MKKNIIGFALACGVITVIGYLYFHDGRVRSVYIGGQKVNVTLASNQAELQRGLGGVQHLDWNQGMLFLFPVAGKYQFWMKDMLIPLDIIWLRGTKITQISENIPPPVDLTQQDNLPLYSSEQLVDTVLEIPAGFVSRYQVKVGDEVVYN